jgi:hypothetical protein
MSIGIEATFACTFGKRPASAMKAREPLNME